MTTPPDPPSARLRAAHFLYQIALHAALPALAVLMLWRSRREPRYRAHLAQRFGLGPVGARGAVWVFAASLGETRAASPLIRALLDAGHAVCLTHSTPAGLDEGRRLFDDPRVTHRYGPIDLVWAVGLFLRRLKPCLGLVVESELWPAQLLVAGRRGIPMVQINGNLLERTLIRDAARLGGLRLELLGRFSAILTKTPVYAARYRRAGVADDRIAVTGELKFDQRIDPAHLREAADLRESWAGTRRVFLIASSVTDEEPALLALAGSLLALPDPPGIIWAPRSPQRFGPVAAALQDAGIAFARRSDMTPPAGAAVILGDTLGEMDLWYALADLVFVGASLVPLGGHNIVEPLAQKKPVVMGPSTFGITFPAEEARAAGALTVVPDADALRREVCGLMTSPAALDRLRARAAAFSSGHLGAARRSMDLLQPLLAAR